jgi:excisionase family DNA binding protein
VFDSAKGNQLKGNRDSVGGNSSGSKPGSLKYAAAKIGCSLPKVYELITAGKLRSYHIGRAHRVSEQAIADCIALLEQEDTQERLA